MRKCHARAIAIYNPYVYPSSPGIDPSATSYIRVIYFGNRCTYFRCTGFYIYVVRVGLEGVSSVPGDNQLGEHPIRSQSGGIFSQKPSDFGHGLGIG
jgi:hypothetical protein